MMMRRVVYAAVAVALAAAAEPISGVVESADGRLGDDYVPAMLSNGRLCVFCDYTLSVPREEPRYEKKKLRPGIWWLPVLPAGTPHDAPRRGRCRPECAGLVVAAA